MSWNLEKNKYINPREVFKNNHNMYFFDCEDCKSDTVLEYISCFKNKNMFNTTKYKDTFNSYCCTNSCCSVGKCVCINLSNTLSNESTNDSLCESNAG